MQCISLYVVYGCCMCSMLVLSVQGVGIVCAVCEFCVLVWMVFMLYECCVCNMCILWVSEEYGYCAYTVYGSYVCSRVVCVPCIGALCGCVGTVCVYVYSVWILYTQCLYYEYSVWMPFCFPSLIGAHSWKHVFKSSMGARSQSWCMSEFDLVVHQRTQNLVITVFHNLLIGYQKSLHH